MSLADTAALRSLGTTKDMRPAGYTAVATGASAADALRGGWADGRLTPERERRYRHVHEPGVRVPAAGPARTETVVDRGTVFGKVERRAEESAAAAIHAELSAMQAYMQERGSVIYRSTQREPLGKHATPGTVLPPRAAGSDMVFGRKSAEAEGAKDLLFPNLPGLEAGQELYIKSHRAYAPGVQRRRGVDFAAAGIDETRHRFGRTAAGSERDGTKQSLDPSLAAEVKAAEAARGAVSAGKARDGVPSAVAAAAQSILVPLRVEAHRRVANDPLGKSRPLGLAEYKRPVPESFGRPPASTDAWGVAECLRGEATAEQTAPDADVGRSLRPGFRNISKDPARVFGKPSLRTDIPPRKHVSMLTRENFGQDPEMKQLLAPPPYASRGVDNGDFTVPRSRDDIRSVFEAVGYRFADFDALYDQAAKLALTPAGSVSIEEFRRVLNAIQDDEERKSP